MKTLKERWYTCVNYLTMYKAKSLTRDKEGHCQIKDSIHGKITILNVNAPNNIASKYMKTTWEKDEQHFTSEGIEMAYKRR